MQGKKTTGGDEKKKLGIDEEKWPKKITERPPRGPKKAKVRLNLWSRMTTANSPKSWESEHKRKVNKEGEPMRFPRHAETEIAEHRRTSVTKKRSNETSFLNRRRKAAAKAGARE